MSSSAPHAASASLVSEEMVLDAAASFAGAIAPGAAERDRRGEVPREELAAFDASGLLAITIPRSGGGPGFGPGTLGEVIRRIAVADPAVAQVPQGHYLIVDAFAVHGAPGAQATLFDGVRAGCRAAASLAERGGADAQALGTRITGPPGRRRVSGRKFYCTGALTAHWIAVNAVDDDGGVVVALLERDAPGITLMEDWTAMGQRATVSGSAILDDVPVEPGMEIPWTSAFDVPQVLGARAQFVHAAIEVGIARAALDDAAWFLGTRSRPFFEAARAGVALRAAEDPHVLQRLGRLATRVRAAEELLGWAGRVLDAVGLIPADAESAGEASIAVAQAKAFGSDVAVQVASELFQVCGTSAADDRWDLHRHWRNSRTHSVHDPVDWKYHHVGAHVVDRRPPPNHGQI